MKNYVLIFAMVILLPFCVSAQKKKHALKYSTVKCADPKIKAYRAWDSFNNDTLAYLKYNFYDRRAAYIGQPFKTLYNDWEIKPVYYIPSREYLTDVSKSRLATFEFDKLYLSKNRYDVKNDSLVLLVKFTTAHDVDLDYKVPGKFDGWNAGSFNIYKDMVVGDILMMNYVVPYPAPKGNEKPNYRRWER